MIFSCVDYFDHSHSHNPSLHLHPNPTDPFTLPSQSHFFSSSFLFLLLVTDWFWCQFNQGCLEKHGLRVNVRDYLHEHGHLIHVCTTEENVSLSPSKH